MRGLSRFLLVLGLIAVFAFLLGRAIDQEYAVGAGARSSLLYPRSKPVAAMSLPELERFQVRALAHYRGAYRAHELVAARRALSSREWTHRRWYRLAAEWTARELRETRERLRPPAPNVDYWAAVQIQYATLIARSASLDPWPNCPDPFFDGASWQDTVDCENHGNWLDSPGYYRCGLQFDPMWEGYFGRRFCP